MSNCWSIIDRRDFNVDGSRAGCTFAQIVSNYFKLFSAVPIFIGCILQITKSNVERIQSTKINKLTLNEKSLLKMYNSAIESVKVSNMFIGLKKTCLGLFERCDSIEDIQRVINE